MSSPMIKRMFGFLGICFTLLGMSKHSFYPRLRVRKRERVENW
jgi:hypothetical protein